MHHTDRLYYSDSTLTDFDAHVLDVDESRTRVILDRSAFYPTSGGQPHDTGTLAGIDVTDVTESGDAVVHHIAAPLPHGVTAVTGHINRARRFDHMQQHSGQHLLSAVLEDRFGWPTVSVHIGSESCSLDLATESVSADALREAEMHVNALVTENRDVTVSFEDAAAATGLRKPSDRSGVLRIVTIADTDRNACGGTHVSRTGEIGPVLLRRIERTRGTTRIEFLCGARAIARARADFEVVQEVAASLSAHIDDVPALVAAMQTESKANEKERVRLQEQLTAFESRALYDKCIPDTNGRRVHHITLRDEPVRSLQLAAQHFTTNPNAAFVAVSNSPPALLLASSHDSNIDCGRMLREQLQSVGGKGGGTPRLAQGSAPDLELAQTCFNQLLTQLAALDER